MTAEIAERWGDFFVASAGAAAALAGLIIVAMTVNIRTILNIPSMTARAAATIGSLVLIVVSTVAALIPGQSTTVFGGELLLFALVALGLTVDAAGRMVRSATPPYVAATWFKIVVAVLQIVPFAVGATMLLTGRTDGLYWMAVGVLLVFIGSVANAWVLLVEILR